MGFYTKVRPFGLWGPVRAKAKLSPSVQDARSESAGLAVLNTVLGMVAITGLYLFPMYLVGHWHGYAALCLLAALAAIGLLAVTWYPNLPSADER